MMLHLKRWLTPPVFPNSEDQTRRAIVLNITLLTMLALVAIILVGGILGGRTPSFILGADVVIMIICLILRRWMYQGRVRLAGAALIGVSLVGTTVLVAVLGTIRAPTSAFYLLIVVSGGLLFDVGGIVVTTVLSSLAVLGLIAAQNAGLLPPPDYAVNVTQWITYTALSGFSGGLTFVALQSTRQALNQAGREIAERKHTEEALRISEQKFRSFVEQSSEGFTLVDEQGTIIEWNRAREQMTGLTRDQVIGRPFWDVQQEMMPREERSDELYRRRRQAIRDALQTGESYLFGRSLEAHVMRPDGEQRFSQQTAFPIKTDQGYRIGSTNRDVTEQRRAEEALHKSEANLNRAQAVAHIGSWQMDIPSNTLRWSAETYRIFGIPMGTKLAVEDFDTHVHPVDREEVSRAWQAALHGGAYDVEHRIIVNSETRWVRERAEVEFDAAGQAVRGIGIVQDITDRKQLEEILRQNRSNLQTILDNFPFLVWLKDAAGRFVAVNEPFARSCGRSSPDDLIGQTDLDIWPAALANRYRADDFRMMRSRQKQIVEELVANQGIEKWFETFKAPLFDLSGNVTGTTGFARDITERKQMEEKLQQRTRELDALQATVLDIASPHPVPELLQIIVERACNLLSSSSGGLYLCHPEREEVECVVSYNTLRDYSGTILKYGEGAAGMVAQTGQPLIIKDYRTWNGRARVYDADQPFSSVLSTPLLWRGQVTGILHVLRDDERRPFTTDELDLLGLFANHAAIAVEQARLNTALERDLTERKQMEAALRQANGTLQALIDHSPLAIIMLSLAGDVVLWNRAAETLYGWKAEEALGRPLLTVPAEKWEEFQAIRMRVNRGELIPYMEVVRTPKDGPDVFLGLAIAPLKDAAGNVYAQMSIAADITERKRAEAALHALNAELEQRVAERTHELTDANARLTQLDRLKDEFIARISHELRTPLTNIKIYLELLEHGKPEKREQYMQTLHAETGKLYQQIDDLLEVSDLQATRIEPQLIRLDINRLVQDLLADRLLQAQARGLSLTIAAEVKQPNLTSDWAMVWQVLSRLIANALAYTPRGGAVTLRADRCAVDDQAWLTIEVRDTGPGISDKDLPHIFEPFYRGAAASDYKTPGTGVGLSIARRISEQLGGHITVDSQPGRGAAFTLWLRAE